MTGLLALSSCGGKFFPPLCTTNCGSTSSGDYLYVANSSTSVSSVAGFTIASGALSVLSNSPYATGLPPNTLAVTPKNTFLYIGSISGGIYAYTINSNGTISVANNGSPVATGVSPITMQVDPTGNWLIAADLSPAVYVFSINTSTGALTTAGNAVALDAGSTNKLYITPNGQYVFISLGTSGVDILTFNTTTGVITKLNQILTPKGSSNADLGLSSDPNSKYLFVTETGINSLRVLNINTTGSSTLTELSTSPVKTGLGPSQVLVTADGSYVYVTNRTDGTISGFTLAANGSLTALSGSPYTTGSAPVDIAEDNTQTYIAVACAGGSPDMQVFQIDTTTPGKLDTFASETTGTDPTLASAIAATH
ncbi:MAG TPA: beta-propeller fold lactonase family protein [Alloacidobacterium sp.]|nr:beta-propeller fold lactonase family protein [Alloacidobacterium sp.]